MTSVADIRSQGTDFLIPSKRLPEPLNAPIGFNDRLTRFPTEVYNLNRDSHLYRYLYALCGDAGAGQLKHDLLYTRLQQMVESTHFGDLDRIFGNPLGLPRLHSLDTFGNPIETYDELDPANQVLTQSEWQLIKARDASYRARCLVWMRAILKGPTLEGLALAAEAAIGVECDIFEQYQYLDNAASDDPITITNVGTTSSPNEFIIIPRLPEVSQEERRRIINLIDLLRPVDTVPTVHSGDRIRTEQAILDVTATSEGFTIQRFVTGRGDISWPTVNPAQGFWIEGNVEKEAPQVAWMERQETATFLTVGDISASSAHVGVFNQTQQAIFPFLAEADNPFYTFDPQFAAAPNTAVLSLTTSWIQR